MRRNGTESCQRLLHGLVRPGRTERLLQPKRLDLRIRSVTGESHTITPSSWSPCRAAVAIVTKPPMLCPITTGGPLIPPADRDTDHLFGPLLERVGVAVCTVPVARQVDREHSELAGERGGDVRPPVGVGAAAVHEHETPPGGFTPREVVDASPADLQLAVVEGHVERAAEPRGCSLVDRDGLDHRGDATQPLASQLLRRFTVISRIAWLRSNDA